MSLAKLLLRGGMEAFPAIESITPPDHSAIEKFMEGGTWAVREQVYERSMGKIFRLERIDLKHFEAHNSVIALVHLFPVSEDYGVVGIEHIAMGRKEKLDCWFDQYQLIILGHSRKEIWQIRPQGDSIAEIEVLRAG